MTRPPWEWLAGAVDDSFTACVAVQRAALEQQPVPAAVVGSSWGGAVAAALLAQGVWAGPTVMLCPALRLKDRWGRLSASHLSAEAVTAGLAALPPSVKRHCLLVHGTADTVVPLADSAALSAATGIELVRIEGGSHGLGSIIRDGRLRCLIDRAVGVVSGGGRRGDTQT